MDRATCQLANHVLLDTQQHIDYFVDAFGLPAAHFTAIPVGCNDEIYTPQPLPAQTNGITHVLGYCTYLPLHGVATILRAAKQVRDLPVVFRLIGSGPLLDAMQALAAEHDLRNVTFAPPTPPVQLASEIAAADICLGGHFGVSDKAARVTPGKIYQMLAVGRAVIAADTPGNRELLHHRKSAYLVPPNDPDALAAALRTLHSDGSLRSQIAQGGRAQYVQQASESVITQQIAPVLENMLETHSPVV
jgi:glycosyltransferase involved in cell wall biosynthesis